MDRSEDLLLLRQRIAEKKQLEAKLDALREQRRSYDQTVLSLRVKCRMEDEDVRELEGKSLANYFLRIVGKHAEKLDKERREALEARVKLDAAEQQLAGIEQDLHEAYAAMESLRDADSRYQKALEEKHAALRASGTEAARQLLETEQQLGELRAKQTELGEALAAGRRSRHLAEQIVVALDRADSWNTWEMVGGGGIISHTSKHSQLDHAQDLVQDLQSSLRRFRTELADIRISADLQISIDGFLRFSDYFFNSLFVDWTVRDHISRSRSSVTDLIGKIERAMERLQSMEAEISRRTELLNTQRETQILQA